MFRVRDSKKSPDLASVNQKVVASLNRSRIPTWRQLKFLGRFLTVPEKRLTGALALLLSVSLVVLIYRGYQKHVEVRPVDGGQYIEGVVGEPLLINPAYSLINDVDQDLVALIFSGLYKRDLAGKLQPDLATGYKIGDDGKSYTVNLRSGAKWHNGDAVTADDVVFTYNFLLDDQYQSPWSQLLPDSSVEKIDDQTVKFTLAEANALFPSLLTFGIMPSGIWQGVTPSASRLFEANLQPIGSGPYEFASLVRDRGGNIKSYNLTVNPDYYGAKPHLQKITFKFFPSTWELISAVNASQLDGVAYWPRAGDPNLAAANSYAEHRLAWPQITGLFFNLPTGGFLSDKNIRQALALVVDRGAIVKAVGDNRARWAIGPWPDLSGASLSKTAPTVDMAKALEILDKDGWKLVDVSQAAIDAAKAGGAKTKDQQSLQTTLASLTAGKWLFKKNQVLTIKITTSDSPEMSGTAQVVADNWRALGVKVDLEIVAKETIRTEVIAPRHFSVLLYSQLYNPDLDAYPFWYSSQSGSSGLNLSGYADAGADKLLEALHLDNDSEKSYNTRNQWRDKFLADNPAIFLYSPDYIYLQDKKIKGNNGQAAFVPSDRFAAIADWYTKESHTLKF